MSAVLEGRVDGIILTGGLVRYDDIVEGIRRRCGWIAPITVYPGEMEQEAMAYSDQPATKEAESSMELEQIVQTALSEAQIESLIIAKGYVDCVAYKTGEGISVAVSSPEGGLQQEDVAVIADIVMTQSDYGLDAIRVVEVQ